MKIRTIKDIQVLSRALIGMQGLHVEDDKLILLCTFLHIAWIQIPIVEYIDINYLRHGDNYVMMYL